MESRFITCGDPSIFCWVLQGRSFSRSGTEVVHTQCVQGAFWEKWKVGLTPERTYPVFVGSCRGGHFSGQGQKLFTRTVPKRLLGKVEGRFNTCRDPSSFWWVLQGMSLSRSGPEVVHTKCVQGTFWEKLKACSTPEGTYPVFVGSCKGGHFPGQAPEPSTRNVPKGLLGKSGRRVQHMLGPIHFLLGPAGEVAFQVRPRSCSHKMCPRDFLGKLEGGFNT